MAGSSRVRSWRDDVADFTNTRDEAAAAKLESPTLPRSSLKRKQPATDSGAETDSGSDNEEGDVKVIKKRLIHDTTGVVIYGKGRNMFEKNSSHRKGKTFEQQFVKTETFCFRLDLYSPDQSFTFEDYKHYWEIAVEKQWEKASTDLFDKWNPDLDKATRWAKLAEEKKTILELIQDDSIKNRTKRPKIMYDSWQGRQLKNRLDNARKIMEEWGTPKVRDLQAMLQRYDGDMDVAEMLEKEAYANNLYGIQDK